MPKGAKEGSKKGKDKAAKSPAGAAKSPEGAAGPPAPEILDDDQAFISIKEKSRSKYKKVWKEFRNFYSAVQHEFDARLPYERELHYYFLKLRQNDGKASSTLWTVYSMQNTVIKSKYGVALKTMPRVGALIKSFDTDTKRKAAIFSLEELKTFCSDPELSGAYWEVRKAIAIVAYFGGLRLAEIMEVELEKFKITAAGIVVTHSRAKQRSDKRETKFCIPVGDDFNWAGCVATYLNRIANDLEKYSGRVWWTGKKDGHFVKVPMGKNMVCAVPNMIASYLGKADPTLYSFHSFRRSSATAAADGGSTPQQMMDFFGWAKSNMPNEYISTSTAQVNSMAKKLAAISEAAAASSQPIDMPVEPKNVPVEPKNVPVEPKNVPVEPNNVPVKNKRSREDDGESSSSEDLSQGHRKHKKIIIIKNVASLKM